jgi:predicted nucleotidyltransferase
LTSYRDIYIEKQIEALRDNPKIVALWEGGSAATGSTDQYSDIDLLALCACETDEAFDLMESVMPPISHRYIEPAGPDLKHRIYFHEGAPKHFFADVGVLSEDSREALKERMVIERHGKPVVFFDHKGLIKPHPVNKIEWQAKLENRINELEDAFPIYILQVLKLWIAIITPRRLPFSTTAYCANLSNCWAFVSAPIVTILNSDISRETFLKKNNSPFTGI